ncbi:hypothetical protein CSOJ01_08250 [Colletotrichum sojae]|uniref:Uncharacterized protein n=1 Tax=Colletotrichum sojae TaxID=2175907 RepID=A0A8H6MT84_9PEZI|nr:hypothetical protein CSOJ01_08250 [Colletotrichum sojae]
MYIVRFFRDIERSGSDHPAPTKKDASGEFHDAIRSPETAHPVGWPSETPLASFMIPHPPAASLAARGMPGQETLSPSHRLLAAAQHSLMVEDTRGSLSDPPSTPLLGLLSSAAAASSSSSIFTSKPIRRPKSSTPQAAHRKNHLLPAPTAKMKVSAVLLIAATAVMAVPVAQVEEGGDSPTPTDGVLYDPSVSPIAASVESPAPEESEPAEPETSEPAEPETSEPATSEPAEPETSATSEPAGEGYGSYGDYKEPEGGYGSYGDYEGAGGDAEPEVEGYGSYGDYKEPEGEGYGSYGDYEGAGAAPEEYTEYGNYGDYTATDYGSYGAYKRALDFIKSLWA